MWAPRIVLTLPSSESPPTKPPRIQDLCKVLDTPGAGFRQTRRTFLRRARVARPSRAARRRHQARALDTPELAERRDGPGPVYAFALCAGSDGSRSIPPLRPFRSLQSLVARTWLSTASSSLPGGRSRQTCGAAPDAGARVHQPDLRNADARAAFLLAGRISIRANPDSPAQWGACRRPTGSHLVTDCGFSRLERTGRARHRAPALRIVERSAAPRRLSPFVSSPSARVDTASSIRGPSSPVSYGSAHRNHILGLTDACASGERCSDGTSIDKAEDRAPCRQITRARPRLEQDEFELGYRRDSDDFAFMLSILPLRKFAQLHSQPGRRPPPHASSARYTPNSSFWASKSSASAPRMTRSSAGRLRIDAGPSLAQ